MCTCLPKKSFTAVHLLFAVHHCLRWHISDGISQMALTNLGADPKGGETLTRADVPELVEAVIEAVKVQTQPPLISSGPKDSIQGTSANAGEPHVNFTHGEKPGTQLMPNVCYHACASCRQLNQNLLP